VQESRRLYKINILTLMKGAKFAVELDDMISRDLVGKENKVAVRVRDIDTAVVHGSGGLPVYATPAMVALMEKAALNLVNPTLLEGYTTVGIRVDVRHTAATPVEMEVGVRAKLVEVDGRRLVFEVEAHDEREVIGYGIHERMVIKKEKFLKKVNEKLDR